MHQSAKLAHYIKYKKYEEQIQISHLQNVSPLNEKYGIICVYMGRAQTVRVSKSYDRITRA